MKPAGILLHVCGILSTFALIWSFVLAVPIFGLVHILSNRRGYHPATFVVERVVYQPANSRNEGIEFDSYWAEGKIEGRDEKLSLAGVLSEEPTSQTQLESLLKPGHTFAVLYNPEVTETMVQGRYLRVITGDSSLHPGHVAVLAAVAYGPFVALLVLAACFWPFTEPRHRRLALFWLVFDACGLLVQAVGAVLMVTLPSLERVLVHH